MANINTNNGSTPGTSNGAAETVVSTSLAGVKNAHESVKPVLRPSLTSIERKRLARVKHKPQQFVARVIDLTIDRPVLAPLGTTPQELVAMQQLRDGLRALLNEVAGFHQELRDKTSVLESDLYTAALSICTIAEQSTVVDAVVAETVAEMRKALASGPRQKHKVTKVAVTTVTVPVVHPASATASPAGSGGNGSGASSTAAAPASASTAAPVNGSAGSSTPAAPATAPAPAGK